MNSTIYTEKQFNPSNRLTIAAKTASEKQKTDLNQILIIGRIVILLLTVGLMGYTKDRLLNAIHHSSFWL
ncbi:MAG: hypothetical protein HOP23_05435 [Methylococcaceae bacterium]|nr:hypothetical protein [Methylococcaceae bacterium]